MAGNSENMENVSDEEIVCSMVDVLKEEQQREEDAAAVLGGSDHKNCTYPLGYVSRQALYACNTCVDDSKTPAAICLACSLECHDGHELFELYTKRNFCCDCGNSKFPDGFKCSLYAEKKAVNVSNTYNQNFMGLYCTCSRPYPDNDDEEDDEMIQCIVCEDWYHGRHLGNKPCNNDFVEMICDGCMSRLDFLWYYYAGDAGVKLKLKETSESIDVTCSNQNIVGEKMVNGRPKNGDTTSHIMSLNMSSRDGTTASSSETNEPTHNLGIASQKDINQSDNSQSSCLLVLMKTRDIEHRSGATFWPQQWRSKLCKCDKCLNMYTQLDVSFLNDEMDTVLHYEEQGQLSSKSQYEQGLQALFSIDRVKQVEVIDGYNNMKTELKDYLKKFADNDKVVRPEDIKEFFETLQARKKQKTGHGVPSFSCR